MVDHQLFCGTCAERPEVDWLTHHYARLEGRRSGLVWFATFLGVMGLMAGIGMLVAFINLFRDVIRADSSPADIRWAAAPVGLIFWSVSALLLQTGKRWALTLNLATSLVISLVFGFSNTRIEEQLLVGVMTLVMTGGFWAVLRQDVRTRLFFRRPVERSELRQHYERYGSNWQAASAARLSALSLLIPPVALISLGLGVWGLARVDKRAVPPVGGFGSALGAIILSILWFVVLGFLIFQ